MALIDHAILSVNEFHQVFGHHINAPLTAEVRTIRANLIEEEAKELIAAIHAKNPVEIVDAMADSVYVVAGSIVALDGTAMSFDKEEMQGVATMANITNLAKTALEDLHTLSHNLLQLSQIYRDPNETASRLIEFSAVNIYNLELVADFMQINIIPALKEVHRSNMTKLWTEDTEMRLQHIASDQERYADIAFRTRDDGGKGLIGYRLSDGKILKSPTYSEADFKPHFNDFLIESVS